MSWKKAIKRWLYFSRHQVNLKVPELWLESWTTRSEFLDCVILKCIYINTCVCVYIYIYIYTHTHTYMYLYFQNIYYGVWGFISFVFWLWWVFITTHGLFSSCCKRGLLSSCSAQDSHCNSFSYGRAQALGMWASVVAERGLSSCVSQA